MKKRASRAKKHRHSGTAFASELLDALALFSHQLRTPLTVIKGYVAMLLDGSFSALAPDQKRAFEKVYTVTERMIRLVNNFLDLPRMHANAMAYNMEPTPLAQVLVHVIAEARLRADFKKIPIVVEGMPPHTCIIKADKENLFQALANILDNAISYTTASAGPVRVRIEEKPGRCTIAITDSGIGIAKKDLPNLFDKFMRGKDMRKLYREGRGLGLFIAKQIIGGHGGKIWAESPGIGKGSTFYIELPTA